MKDKEAIYDAEIAPLMTQILEVCKREQIAMIASFDIPNDDDPELACTSMVPDEDGNPERHQHAHRIINGGSLTPPMRITTRGAGGAVVRDEVIMG
jgi:hypothetical protein